MATKDWKKDEHYKNHWNNKKNNHAIMIQRTDYDPSQPKIKKWVVKHANKTYWYKDEYFKTKKQALKYAKAYMGKH